MVGEGMDRISISFVVYCVSQGNHNTHDFDLELGNVVLRCADSDIITSGSAHSMKTSIFMPRDRNFYIPSQIVTFLLSCSPPTS